MLARSSNSMTKYEKIEAKKREIANYERILADYYGRWYDQGKRYLESLKAELLELETSFMDEPPGATVRGC